MRCKVFGIKNTRKYVAGYFNSDYVVFENYENKKYDKEATYSYCDIDKYDESKLLIPSLKYYNSFKNQGILFPHLCSVLIEKEDLFLYECDLCIRPTLIKIKDRDYCIEHISYCNEDDCYYIYCNYTEETLINGKEDVIDNYNKYCDYIKSLDSNDNIIEKDNIFKKLFKKIF